MAEDLLNHYFLSLENTDKDCFGERLRFVRRSLDFTQEDMANILRLSRASVNSLEKINSVTDVKPDSLFRLYYFFQRLSTQYKGYEGYLCDMVNGILNDIIMAINSNTEDIVDNGTSSKFKQNIKMAVKG